MSAEDSLNDRTIAIESHLLHLDHDLEQLNSVIVAQQADIDSLKRMVQRLESQLDRTAESPMQLDPNDPDCNTG